MSYIMKYIFLIILSLCVGFSECFSQTGDYLDIGSWKVRFEKDREFTISIISQPTDGEANSVMEYYWDDVLLFLSENANRNSYITIDNEQGKEFFRFTSKRQRKSVSIRVDFKLLKTVLDMETPYRIIIHNQNQELPLMLNFTISNNKDN